jgi:hypothetical protein
MSQRIQIRRDSSDNWSSTNPILAQGELGFDIDANAVKIGDGSTHWLDLPLINNVGLAIPGSVDPPPPACEETCGHFYYQRNYPGSQDHLMFSFQDGDGNYDWQVII